MPQSADLSFYVIFSCLFRTPLGTFFLPRSCFFSTPAELAHRHRPLLRFSILPVSNFPPSRHVPFRCFSLIYPRPCRNSPLLFDPLRPCVVLLPVVPSPFPPLHLCLSTLLLPFLSLNYPGFSSLLSLLSPAFFTSLMPFLFLPLTSHTTLSFFAPGWSVSSWGTFAPFYELCPSHVIMVILACLRTCGSLFHLSLCYSPSFQMHNIILHSFHSPSLPGPLFLARTSHGFSPARPRIDIRTLL